MAGMPPRGAAQYADNAADVSPVDAQATAWMAFGFCLRSLFTCRRHVLRSSLCVVTARGHNPKPRVQGGDQGPPFLLLGFGTSSFRG